MRYYGRILTTFVVIVTVAAWHASYFLIDPNLSYQYFIVHGFLRCDFIYTPLVLPFFWWVGKKYDEAKFYSERDPLTSLYNRRFILRVFPALLERANRVGEKLHVYLVDIDGFKDINDTRGHDVGDAVIQDVARSLQRSTNPSDVVARWGGDEYIVLAMGSGQGLESSLFGDAEGRLDDSSRRLGVRVSVSMGCSTYPDSAKLPDDLIRMADESMYACKASKGNREDA